MIEADILNTSRAWVEVVLGPIDKDPYYRISTIQSDTGSFSGDGFIADSTALITSAKIEGIVPGGRTGTIVFKDLSGIWPNRMADVGRAGSSMASATGPNLRFSFGWKGLRRRDEYDGRDKISSLTAIIQGVKFDINDDGSINITIDFINYSSVVFQDIIAFDPMDIIRSDKDNLWEELVNINGGEDPTGIDVINYVLSTDISDDSKEYAYYGTYWSGLPDTRLIKNDQEKLATKDAGFSYGVGLKSKKVGVLLKSTHYKAAKLKNKNDIVSIDFGLPLSTWINQMLQKVTLEEEDVKKAEEDGLIITYERKPDLDSVTREKYPTIVIFDWKVTINPQSTEAAEDEDKIKSDYETYMSEKDRITKYSKGPVLYWKAGQEAYSFNEASSKVEAINTYSYDGEQTGEALISKKRLLSWDSDLSSYNQLFRMFKDTLAEKLHDLQQRDSWEDFIDIMGEFENFEDMEKYAKDNRSGRQKLRGWFNGDRERYKVIGENFNDVSNIAEQLQPSNNSQKIPNKDQTLESILAQNSFKVNAEIMGDPDIGTLFQGGSTIITTDFTFAGEEGYLRRVFDGDGNMIDVARESLIHMFSRQWILLKSEHNFGEDGSYTTKVELQGYLPLINIEEYNNNKNQQKRIEIDGL